MEKIESKVTCTGVSAHAFKPELDSAQLEQEVVSSYPTRYAESGGLFSAKEYGLETKDFSGKKVCWIDVPKGTTAEQVQARIDALPKARIQRILSMKPILSENQKAAIEKGLTTLEEIAEKQTVKDAEGNVVLHNGAIQYKKLQASWNGAEDVDLRTAKAVTEANVIVGETIAEA